MRILYEEDRNTCAWHRLQGKFSMVWDSGSGFDVMKAMSVACESFQLNVFKVG